MQELIKTARPRAGILLVTLNRPEYRNALNNALLTELAQVLADAREDDALRVAVLAGDERTFSAGSDLKEMQARGIDAIDDPQRQAAWDSIAAFPKPLIAAIEGIAYGGGHELAMLADIIVAGADARFAQPEVNIGWLPGDGATQRLARSTGKSMTMRLVLSGEPIDAQTAQRAGLVAEVVPVGGALERALELAGVIAGKPPIAVRLAKRAVLDAYETTLEDGLAAERQAVRFAFTTEDAREGLSAFLEKRPPHFHGR